MNTLETNPCNLQSAIELDNNDALSHYRDKFHFPKSIIGSFNGSYSLQTAIPMLADLVVAGHMSLKEMISSKRPLSEINEAMEALEEINSLIGNWFLSDAANFCLV